jgi:hypothetical protein
MFERLKNLPAMRSQAGYDPDLVPLPDLPQIRRIALWTYPDRPSVSTKVAELVVQMARENSDWGYDRIAGAIALVTRYPIRPLATS